MNNLIQSLTQLRTPGAQPLERQQARRLLLINLAWIVITLLLIPVFIWWFFVREDITYAIAYAPVSILLALVIHHRIQTWRLASARRLFVLNTLLAALLATFPEFRIDTPLIMLTVIPIIAAGVLLSRSGFASVTVLTVAIITLGGLVQFGSGMGPTPFKSDIANIAATIATVGGVSIVTALLLWSFSSNANDVLRQRQQMTELLSIMAGISRTLVDMPTVPSHLDHAVEQLRDALGLYHVQVFLADPNTDLATLHASTGFIGRKLLEDDNLSRPHADSPINAALRRKDPLLLDHTSPAEQHVSFLPATRSELLLPLVVGDLMPLGVLDLHSTESETFSGEILNVLVMVSNHLAVALYSARQSSELKTNYAERTQLIEQFETNQRELARLNRQIIGSTWGAYLTERQEAALGYEWRDNMVQLGKVETDTLNLALVDGQSHLESRIQGDIMSVPIRLRGQVLGALEFRRRGDTHWTPAALEMAQAVADRLALSLENARLFEQAQSTAQREQLVSHVMSQLQTTTNLQTLLALAAREFQNALGATHTQVRLGLPEDAESSDGDHDNATV